MNWIKILLITLGVSAPNVLFSQENNRISLQTGLFHCFFDGSAIINSQPTNQGKRIYNYKILSNLLNGVVNDSRGINYQRKINNLSNISLEYMNFATDYYFTENIDWRVKPIVAWRNIKFLNMTYSRVFPLNNSIKMTYGAGINYIWGREVLYHYTTFFGSGEPLFYSYYRNDIGANFRLGVEYSPKPWLTLFSNFDYIGIAYLGAKDIDGIKVGDYYQNTYNLKNIPSKSDISWRFGVGFNFGK